MAKEQKGPGQYYSVDGRLVDLPAYQCHKRVHAIKIGAVVRRDDGVALLVPDNATFPLFPVTDEYIDRHSVNGPGYYVLYEDGYASWSPITAFEQGYALLN